MEEKKLKQYIKKLEEQNEHLRKELSRIECERDAYKSIVEVYNDNNQCKTTIKYNAQDPFDDFTDAITKSEQKREEND